MSDSGALPLTISGVRKHYGRVRALDGVDLHVRAGEFLTLLGPSGSGKTTLLMVLAGFVRPDGGGVCFGDEEMILAPPHRRNVGMVFQNYALFPHMDVAGNIAYPLKLRGMSKSAAAEKVARALELVRLSGFGGRRVHQLSGGQMQRVALARAVVFAPRILLMDEPLSALDKKLREQMQTELRQLHDKLGMTTVYVTHDQREALTMSDRIAVFNEGNVVQLGAPREIYGRPANAFVADFIGESAMLPVRARGGEVFYRGDARMFVAEDSPPDGGYFLLLRPECLEVSADSVAADGHNIFCGAVAGVSYQGESVLLRATLDDGAQISARIADRKSIAALPPPGGRVNLSLRREDAVLIPRDGGE
ncbi:MAG: ABC transporter ATP-binding protein [Gammaproteobacteria bacterium]